MVALIAAEKTTGSLGPPAGEWVHDLIEQSLSFKASVTVAEN